MKTQNTTLGLQTHSARYPIAYTMWSQYPEHSRPELRRTTDSIVRDDAARQQAEKHPQFQMLIGSTLNLLSARLWIFC